MVKINHLTYLTFELNALVDKGLSRSQEETKRLCEERRIFDELERRLPFMKTGLDLSVLNKETREEISEAFRDFVGINERRKLGVENNGLCLLIVYTQKIIKEKAGNLRKFQKSYSS